MAEDLIAAFAAKGIRQKFSSRETFQILNRSGLVAQQLKSGITEYRTTWIDGVHNPKNFCEWLLAKIAKQRDAEQRETEFLEVREQQILESKKLQEQVKNDPAYHAKILLNGASKDSFQYRIGLHFLDKNLADGNISQQDYKRILAENALLLEQKESAIAIC